MVRLLSPDGACKQIEVEGARTGRARTYVQDKGGAFHVDNPAHEKALRAVGCTPAVTRAAGRRGWRCEDCGFVAVFKKCGRCGSTAMTEE